jgi:GT2 family glycosyltransferase
VENGANLGFAKGNNAGIRVTTGEYVLILNPDTIIRSRALDKLIRYADQHPDAGAFGCRILNPDGSLQISARPQPTVLREFLSAAGLRWLGRFSSRFLADVYVDCDFKAEREIDWHSGCCVLVRGDLLKRLDGFDERFFYHFEETDLCLRVRKSGASIRFYPDAEVTHLGGQSVGRFPIRFALETYRSRYRYFYKHYGPKATRQIRHIALLRLGLRQALYGCLRLFKSDERLENRLAMYRIVRKWNQQLDPIRFIETGSEPDLGYAPLAPAPKLMQVQPSSN